MRKIILVPVCVAIAVLFTGCLAATQLEDLGWDIAGAFPHSHFSKELSLSLGPASLGMIRFATGFSEDGRDARRYLTGVRKIELVVYNVDLLRSYDAVKVAAQVGELIEKAGWQTVVKSREKNDLAWILYREADGIVRDLSITSVDERELVLIRISGRLNDLFDKAMQDHKSLTGIIDRNKPKTP